LHGNFKNQAWLDGGKYTMKCPNCGFDNQDSARFCNECATELSSDGSAAVQETVSDSENEAQIDTEYEDTNEESSKKYQRSKNVAITVILVSISLVLVFGALVAGLLYFGKKHGADENKFVLEATSPAEVLSDGKYLSAKNSYWLNSKSDGTCSIYNKNKYIGDMPIDLGSTEYLYSPDKSSVIFFGSRESYIVTDSLIKKLDFAAPSEYDMSSDGTVIYYLDENNDLYRCNANDGSIVMLDRSVCREKYLNVSPDGNTVLYHKAVKQPNGDELYDMYICQNNEISKVPNNNGYLCGYSVSNGANTIYASDIALDDLYIIDADGDSHQIGNPSSAVVRKYLSSDKEDIMLMCKDSVYIKEYTESLTEFSSFGSMVTELAPLQAYSSANNFVNRVFQSTNGYFYLTSNFEAYKLSSGDGSDHAVSTDASSFYYVNTSKQLVKYPLGDTPSEGRILVNGGVNKMRLTADGAVWYLTDTFELHCIYGDIDTLVASDVYSFDAAFDSTVFFETWADNNRSGRLMCAGKSNSPVLVDTMVDAYYCMPGYTCYIKNFDENTKGADIYIGVSGNSFALAAQNSNFGPLSY